METDVLTSSFMTLRDKLHHIALSYLESDEDARDALQDRWENYCSLDAIVDTHDPFTLKVRQGSSCLRRLTAF